MSLHCAQSDVAQFQTAADVVEENVSEAEQRNAMNGKRERESDNDCRRGVSDRKRK